MVCRRRDRREVRICRDREERVEAIFAGDEAPGEGLGGSGGAVCRPGPGPVCEAPEVDEIVANRRRRGLFRRPRPS